MKILHLLNKSLLLYLVLTLSQLPFASSQAQNIYKTPSGKKYHLASCRMVENVSRKLLSTQDIAAYRLTPCKFCRPPVQQNLLPNYNTSNKAVGTAATVRCQGITQKGTRCKHLTRLANGYCYQHTAQNSTQHLQGKSSTKTSNICGAKTKAGGACQRKVSGGGRCWQH